MYYDLELFGKYVCEIRKSLSYTQSYLSELTEITTETMRKIENGKVIPTQVTLERLSSVLKVDLNLMILNYRLNNYKEFYEIKDNIESKLESGNYVNLNEDLEKLNTILDNRDLNNYMSKSIKQLSLLLESVIIKITHKDYYNSLEKLIDAMRITTPSFDLDKYNKYVYSSFEIRILMNIALLLNALESKDKCLEILLFCLDALNPDEIEFKLRILYNISYTYHRQDLNEKALYYANEGIRICVENNSLSCLALLFSRKGIAEYFLNQDSHKASLNYALNLYDLTNKGNLKDMLLKFCTEHNIDII